MDIETGCCRINAPRKNVYHKKIIEKIILKHANNSNTEITKK